MRDDVLFPIAAISLVSIAITLMFVSTRLQLIHYDFEHMNRVIEKGVFIGP